MGLTTLTTFMCRLSINSGSLNPSSPKGLSGPVMGYLYLLIFLWNIKLIV
jgi:hypothetical protein